MAPINKTIEDDLRVFKNFCEHEKLWGTHSMLYFYGLLDRYPLEYLLYSRDTPFHTPYREKAKITVAKKFENKIVPILNTKLSEEQVSVLNGALRQLEGLTNSNAAIESKLERSNAKDL